MGIKQLNGGYVPAEDRILLRVSTDEGQEFRFWLTRRLTLRLMPVLQQTVGRMESSTPQMVAPDPASQQILTDLKRDAFMQKADFKTAYVEQVQQRPLGEEPMLVTDVQLQLQGTAVLLTLQDKGAVAGQTQSCQLNLQASLVHGLIHLIGQAMDKAGWQAPDATPEPMAPIEVPATGYRH